MRNTLAVTLGFIVLGCSFAAHANPLEMKLLSMWPESQTQMVEVVIPWAEKVREATNGEIVVNVFAVGALVDALENRISVKEGLADIGIWVSYPHETPAAFLTGAPYMAKSIRNCTDVLLELATTVPAIKAEIDDQGVFLGFSCSAPLIIASVHTPIRTPEDINGKLVLVVTPNNAPMIEAWGGVPIYITQDEVYSSLRSGMGEVYLSGASNVRGLRIMEVAKYMTQPGFPSAGGFYITMNRDTFESLPTEQQHLMLDLGRQLANSICESFVKDYQISVEAYKDGGAEMIELTPEALEKFRVATLPMLPIMEHIAQQAGLENTAALIEEYYRIANDVPFRE